jgi:hypothetical protein
MFVYVQRRKGRWGNEALELVYGGRHIFIQFSRYIRSSAIHLGQYTNKLESINTRKEVDGREET